MAPVSRVPRWASIQSTPRGTVMFAAQASAAITSVKATTINTFAQTGINSAYVSLGLS
jgi:hypothetical protein